MRLGRRYLLLPLCLALIAVVAFSGVAAACTFKETILTGGDQSGAHITVPVGTAVHDRSWLNRDPNNPQWDDPVTHQGANGLEVAPDYVDYFYGPSCSEATTLAGQGHLVQKNSDSIEYGVSDSVVLPAGTWWWKAIYHRHDYDVDNVRPNNPRVDPLWPWYEYETETTCDESVTVVPPSPGIQTVPVPTSALLGTAIHDTATVTNAGAPATVTFRLYGPGGGCSEANLIYTSTVDLVNGAATSGAFTPLAVGTYSWIATYSGPNGASATHDCGVEAVIITAPELTPSPSPTPPPEPTPPSFPPTPCELLGTCPTPSPSPTPSPTPVVTPTPEPTPGGSVAPATGRPATPPPGGQVLPQTTVDGSSGGRSGNSMSLIPLILLVVAGGSLGLFLTSPYPRRTGR